MNAKTRKLADELLALVNSIRDNAMYHEVARVQNLIIPMAEMIKYGMIDRLTAFGVDQLECAIREIRTFVEHGTWNPEATGVLVETSDLGGDGVGSEVITIGGWRKVRISGLVGKHVHGLPLKREIDKALAGLGFAPCAFAERTSAGVIFRTHRADPAHTWQACSHRPDFASEAEHDRDCPAAPANL